MFRFNDSLPTQETTSKCKLFHSRVDQYMVCDYLRKIATQKMQTSWQRKQEKNQCASELLTLAKIHVVCYVTCDQAVTEVTSTYLKFCTAQDARTGRKTENIKENTIQQYYSVK